ncbi:hypothetical protein QEN19_000838 [Hanseniaspora menglaensis]
MDVDLIQEFYTPASKETVDFRVSLIKQYPSFITYRKRISRTSSNSFNNYDLKKLSSFSAKGNIAKIIEYKDGKKLLSTHKGDVAEFSMNEVSDSYNSIYNHHNTRVSALAYDAKDDIIISGGLDGTLIIGASQQEMMLHNDRIVNLQRLNHSSHLISISHDSTWSLVDYNSCKKLYQQEGYSSPLTALTISLYDNLLVTTDSNEFQLHDLRSGSLISRKTKAKNDTCHAMALLPDNRQLVASGVGNLKLFDLRYFDEKPALSEILVHSGKVITSLDYKDNTIVTTGFNDGSIEFSNIANGKLTFLKEKNQVAKKVVVSDDKLLCCKIMDDGIVYTGGFGAKVGMIH